MEYLSLLHYNKNNLFVQSEKKLKIEYNIIELKITYLTHRQIVVDR